MRKIFLASVLVLALCAAQMVEPASVGLAGTQPEQGRYLVGIEYNTLKGRPVCDPVDTAIDPAQIDASGNQYIGKFTYGVTNRLAVVVKGGTADLKLWNSETSVAYEHSSGTAGGIGVRGVFYEDLSLGLSLGASAQYFAFSPKDDAYYKRSAKWKEWDGALCLSILNEYVDTTSLIQPFTLTAAGFHVGARYSDVRIDWTTAASEGKLDAKENTGFFTGFDLFFNNRYLLSVEARLNDEKAYTWAFSFKL